MTSIPEGFVRAARVDEVPEGSFAEIEIGEDVLLLAHLESGFYAVTAWCSHQGTSLALGTLDGPVIRCWAHLWSFDVRTGEPVWPQMARVAPGYRLRVHPVRVEGDQVLVSATPRLGR